jgi:hypothetical protein
MKRLFLIGIALVSILPVMAQGGNLEFNQVIKMTAATGQMTVPANKVWKVTASTSGSAVYYSNYSSTSPSWSVTNPDPCTGATAGSPGSIPFLYKFNCPDANNKVVVDGTKYSLSSTSPMWLPAGSTLELSSTPCVNNLSPSVAANTPYRVRDETGPSVVYYYECDGPISQGAIPNGIFISIIEFNIVP